jgi:hypothetical protein
MIRPFISARSFSGDLDRCSLLTWVRASEFSLVLVFMAADAKRDQILGAFMPEAAPWLLMMDL